MAIWLAPENNPEEQIPWDNIIKDPANTPNFLLERKTKITKHMCDTEVYAINFFISFSNIQIILIIAPPKILNIFNSKTKLSALIKYIKRKIPNPANLSKMAAKTMEPLTGASTWARGSQVWKKNIGNFTKNPKRRALIFKKKNSFFFLG